LPRQRSQAADGHRAIKGMSDQEDNVDRDLFRNVEKLRQLRIEHRDLDEVISRLSMDIHIDELQLKRLKKRKLVLKDLIMKLESQLIPDLNA
jgi:hypothetical protein